MAGSNYAAGANAVLGALEYRNAPESLQPLHARTRQELGSIAGYLLWRRTASAPENCHASAELYNRTAAEYSGCKSFV